MSLVWGFIKSNLLKALETVLPGMVFEGVLANPAELVAIFSAIGMLLSHQFLPAAETFFQALVVIAFGRSAIDIKNAFAAVLGALESELEAVVSPAKPAPTPAPTPAPKT